MRFLAFVSTGFGFWSKAHAPYSSKYLILQILAVHKAFILGQELMSFWLSFEYSFFSFFSHSRNSLLYLRW
ncbi:MAG: hypothetical protein ACJAS6_001396 [Rickettsiales bacterium]|jgi:hypothetical protein